MATNSYLTLGQSAPNAAAATDLYTVPALTSTVASTLVICNRGVTTTVRVAIRPGGAALANQHYIVYDQYINANDSLFLTLGLTLAAGTVVTVYANNATVSFNLYGTEIS